ncbi:UPF0262 family protein [Oleispirillum naphthae]|uniref:UPF0262 family protein n=1 Tax=Oleispirillum naphthae TaxID=2838853 RepID=UPI0030823C08
MDKPHSIAEVTLDERTLHPRPEVEHERAVAIFDLLEENAFRPLDWDDEGPYALHLALSENRLVLDVRHAGAPADSPEGLRMILPLSSFRSTVRDYFLVCESYYDAIKTATPSQIEAIDMGRRGLHNEGSEMMRERLADKVEIDHQTARRLFTLLCVLYLKT